MAQRQDGQEVEGWVTSVQRAVELLEKVYGSSLVGAYCVDGSCVYWRHVCAEWSERVSGYCRRWELEVQGYGPDPAAAAEALGVEAGLVADSRRRFLEALEDFKKGRATLKQAKEARRNLVKRMLSLLERIDMYREQIDTVSRTPSLEELAKMSQDDERSRIEEAVIELIEKHTVTSCSQCIDIL